MSTLIKQGYGAPVVMIMTPDGELIKDEQGNQIGRFATNFEYVYDEEGEDKCTITFQSSDIQLANNPLFRINLRFLVSWGYTQQQELIVSPKRLVLINDMESKYEPDKITITLKCSDIASKGFLSSSNSTNEDNNYLDFLAEIGAGVFKPAVVVYNDDDISEYAANLVSEISASRKADFGAYSDDEALISLEDFKKGANTHGYPEDSDEWPLGSKTKDKTDFKIDPKTKNAANIEQFFKNTKITPCRSLAVLRAIKDQLKEAPGGPYLLDTRDDKLTIHNRNYNQSPIENYRYAGEGGDVISVTIKTENKASAKAGNVSSMDPETKTTTNSHLAIMDGSKLDEQFNFHGISDEEAQKQVDEMTTNNAKSYFDAYVANPGSTVKAPYISIHKKMGTLLQGDFNGAYNTQSSAGTKRGTLRADITNPLATTRQKSYGLYEDFDIMQVESTATLTRANFDLNFEISAETVYAGVDNEHVIKNKVRETIQKLVQGTMIIIGNPYIESSKMISLENISNNQIGKFYVKKVTHTITQSDGFKTTLDIMKKPVTISVSSWGGTKDKKTFQDMVKEKGRLTAEGETQIFFALVAAGEKLTVETTEQELYDKYKKTGLPIKKGWVNEDVDLSEIAKGYQKDDKVAKVKATDDVPNNKDYKTKNLSKSAKTTNKTNDRSLSPADKLKKQTSNTTYKANTPNSN